MVKLVICLSKFILGKQLDTKNGLALSSRNSYLNHNEIIIGCFIKLMKETCEEIRGSNIFLV